LFYALRVARRHPAKVLIVEDDPQLRSFYRSVLLVAGYSVVEVEDGIDALRLVETDPPDAVILDLGLPRLAGRDVKRELRAHAETRSIPILVVTGSDSRTLDPTDFRCVVRKPISAEGLVSALEQCLRVGAQQHVERA